MKYEELMMAGATKLAKAMTEAQTIRQKNFGKRIFFYAPSFTYYKTEYYCSSPAAFPSISITGSSCSLKCKHCNGIVLNTMYPARSPERLVELCRDLRKKGAVGVLISGGCSPDGSMPFEKFLDAMVEIKHDLKLSLMVHTGLVSGNLAERLKEVGIDAALIDIVGSEETIREIYNLKVTIADYERSLQALFDVGIPTVPHVLAGLHYGKLKGEFQALNMIANYNPSAVIIIVFMPIRGTAMEKVEPPDSLTVGKLIVTARFLMQSTPLVLGCMRPKGMHRAETDVLAIKAGVNAIAFPSEKAIQIAESLGYEISFSPSCCAQIFNDLRTGKFNEGT
ncbi:MAG: radical SAM protein [Candidatus Bathyarchaeota archaeon]|nr:MAG: radical SAM protein [Candidatus Bathyarchaeota archaeon]